MNFKVRIFGALCALALSSLACQQDCYRAGDQETVIGGKPAHGCFKKDGVQLNDIGKWLGIW
jgi:hypothetical protein